MDGSCNDDELLLREMRRLQEQQQQPQASGGGGAEEQQGAPAPAFRAVPVPNGHAGRDLSALLKNPTSTSTFTNPWAYHGEGGNDETQDESGGGAQGGGAGRPRRRRMERGPRPRDEGKDLRRAATNNNTQELETLVAQGVAIDSADGDGKQALHYAARTGAIEAVRVLLELRADPNAPDKWGSKPVDEAEYWSVKPVATAAEDVHAHHQKYWGALQELYAYGGTRSDPRARSDAVMHINRLKRAEEFASVIGLPVPWPALTGSNALPIGWAEAAPCLALPPPLPAEHRAAAPQPPTMPEAVAAGGSVAPLQPPRPRGPPPQEEQAAPRPQHKGPPAPPPPPPQPGGAPPGVAPPGATGGAQDIAALLAENEALRKENADLRVRLFLAEQKAAKINGGIDSGKGV